MKRFDPTLIHVPHSSLFIPSELQEDYLTTDIERELLLLTDRYCDELFSCSHETLIYPYSRLVCDVERFRDDRNEAMALVGMGAVYTHSSQHKLMRVISGSKREQLLCRYYDPHQAELLRLVKLRLEAFNCCLIIDGHSFPQRALPYEYASLDNRPDFCLGTCAFHTPPALAAEMVHFIQRKGYSVSLNTPFAGTMVPLPCYLEDKRVKSVMIEINRGLYMKDDGEKSGSYWKTKVFVRELVELAAQNA